MANLSADSSDTSLTPNSIVITVADSLTLLLSLVGIVLNAWLIGANIVANDKLTSKTNKLILMLAAVDVVLNCGYLQVGR